jgi:hypothetical protein
MLKGGSFRFGLNGIATRLDAAPQAEHSNAQPAPSKTQKGRGLGRTVMTVADRLRQQAAELVRLADELDRVAPMPAPGRDRFFLDTGRAMKISRRSSSWLYKVGRQYGFGWQLPSGAWAFSETRLVDFLGGHASACEESELCEKNDAPSLPGSPEVGHGEKSA